MNPWATLYVPQSNVPCPTGELVRAFSFTNQTLNQDEANFVDGRVQVTNQAWKDWLGDGSRLGYNMASFSKLPRVGLAMSSGGFRSTLFSMGVLNAFDSGNSTAKAIGTGGFAQTSTFMSGASGRSSCIVRDK